MIKTVIRGEDLQRALERQQAFFERTLPRCSPTCAHFWQHDALRHAYVCDVCGSEITEAELVSRHEGEAANDAN